MSGYHIEDWIADLKAKLDFLNVKEEERKLKAMEDKLDQLLSDEKKVEMFSFQYGGGQVIKIVEGDLMNATENIIGHQVNCQSVMGSGVARAIRDTYEAAYVGYMNYCDGKEPYDLLGTCHLVDIGNGKFVAHLFGQLNYGRTKYRYTDYIALKEALYKLKVIAKRNNLSVALPYNIGCGLANGDWKVVSQIIEEVFEDYEVTLYSLFKIGG
ncbi:hypothetical protein PCURB6_26990 [Paenibacillus curdlanolyticus]|nr:hypothetical protein PCURB6_26990 [Paenibacillus curdlanolyticus]